MNASNVVDLNEPRDDSDALGRALRADIHSRQAPFPGGIDLEAVKRRGRRRRLVRVHAARAGGLLAVAATAAGVAITTLPVDVGAPRDAGRPAGQGPADSRAAADAARAQMLVQQEDLNARLSRSLEAAGVQLAEPVNLIAAEDWDTHLWQALLTVQMPSGEQVPVRVGLRAPGPAPTAAPEDRGVSDVAFPTVDCAAARPFSRPASASPPGDTAREDLAECAVTQEDGGDIVSTTSWIPQDGTAGAANRRSVLRAADGALVWVQNGHLGDGQVLGLTTEEQRRVVRDPSLRLDS